MPAAQHRTRHRRRNRRASRGHRTGHGGHRRGRVRGARVGSNLGRRDRRFARSRAQRSGCAADRRRRRRRARRRCPHHTLGHVDRQQAGSRDAHAARASAASAHRPRSCCTASSGSGLQRAGVRIHDAKKLIRVDEHPDSVTAHFADGTSASADVLIGADGVHSTVRRLIDPRCTMRALPRAARVRGHRRRRPR